MTDAQTPTAAVPVAPHRRRPAILVVGAVVVAVVGIVGLHRWQSSLDVLAGVGPTVSGPAEVGHTYYVDAGLGPVADGSGDVAPSVTVTLDTFSAAGLLDSRTATSETIASVPLDAVVCVRNGSNNGIGVAEESDLSASCSSVQPLTLPATLDLGFDSTQVLYRVRVTTPGTYKVDGALVEYHQGMRRGTLRLTAQATLVAVR